MTRAGRFWVKVYTLVPSSTSGNVCEPSVKRSGDIRIKVATHQTKFETGRRLSTPSSQRIQKSMISDKKSVARYRIDARRKST
jgi:hypothetical protein